MTCQLKNQALASRLLTASAIIAVVVYVLIEAKIPGDFSIYLQGSVDLFRGKDIYVELYNRWYHYYYSVLFAILLYPLQFIPFYAAQIIWLLLNALFCYRIGRIIAGYLREGLLTKWQRQLLLGLCLLFSFRFLVSNFHLKQMTICILYLSLEGLNLVQSGKKAAGALLIAFAVNIKLMPLVLLPYLLYRNELKAFVYCVLFYAAMLLIPASIFGWSRNTQLLESWLALVNPFTQRNILDVDERSFHSLSTLLATLLVKNVPDSQALHIRRNIMDISLTQLTYVLYFTRLTLILFSLWFFRTKPFKASPGRLHSFRETAYLLLLVPLIFPHQQGYGFLFIMPAVCFVLYYLLRERSRMPVFKFRVLATGCVTSYLACNLAILLGQFHNYYDHFKILTYGALLVIPLLAACPPPSDAEKLTVGK